jgi:hypothetical protein
LPDGFPLSPQYQDGRRPPRHLYEAANARTERPAAKGDGSTLLLELVAVLAVIIAILLFSFR